MVLSIASQIRLYEIIYICCKRHNFRSKLCRYHHTRTSIQRHTPSWRFGDLNPNFRRSNVLDDIFPANMVSFRHCARFGSFSATQGSYDDGRERPTYQYDGLKTAGEERFCSSTPMSGFRSWRADNRKN